MFFPKNLWNPENLHVYVTGGSTGLGLSIAVIMAKKGAHVSIVARNKVRLDQALQTLEEVRNSPSQKFNTYSYSLTSCEESEKAFRDVCAAHDGRAPDAVFNCAGSAKPKFFIELTKEELEEGLANSYWIETWTAWIAAKEMVRQGIKGKIIFIASTLAYMSFVGWANYAPGRHALRGLTDTLESEFRLYDIGVHTFFPPNMMTASFVEENKTKPYITKKIEGEDISMTSEQAAAILLKGIEKGQAHITGDWITTSFRASTRGATHSNNFIVDSLWNFFAMIAIPVWRRSVDSQIENHKKEHREYLKSIHFLP